MLTDTSGTEIITNTIKWNLTDPSAVNPVLDGFLEITSPVTDPEAIAKATLALTLPVKGLMQNGINVGRTEIVPTISVTYGGNKQQNLPGTPNEIAWSMSQIKLKRPNGSVASYTVKDLLTEEQTSPYADTDKIKVLKQLRETANALAELGDIKSNPLAHEVLQSFANKFSKKEPDATTTRPGGDVTPV